MGDKLEQQRIRRRIDALKKLGFDSMKCSASTRKVTNCFESMKTSNPNNEIIINIVKIEKLPANKLRFKWYPFFSGFSLL